MLKIGSVSLKSPLVLAPMAGISDLPMRRLCRSFGASLCYSEMVSAKALHYKDKKTKTLLKSTEDDAPLSVQIFGHEPEIMAEGARLALEISNADIVDINMGCPVNKVVKSGDGSALMTTPELAAEIVRAVKAEVSVPVTVKIRMGWDKGSVNGIDFALLCEKAGADAVAIHGRTRTQMYRGVANCDFIKELKKHLSVPLIANGDIFSPEDALNMQRHTGADFLMIGRGALGDPWIFERSLALLEGRTPPEEPSVPEKLETAFKLVLERAELKGEKIACIEARGDLSRYLRGAYNATEYKRRFSSVSSIDEIRREIDRVIWDMR